MTPELTLVVAHADNRVIGRDNRLPWHLPADLKHFKGVTLGKPVVMGRRTWESIGRALPGRLNIVVSSQSVTGDLVTVRSLDAALGAAGAVPEVCVIGGARLFAEALPRAARIHLTEVHADIEGDVYFPPLEPGVWREVSREFRVADERNAYPMSFVVLERG
ncbi:MAG: type 3 dihydrofolate reductase [Xanthomonadaceae bacterium]|nr:type 3 dihydrofolate reductase [Xanthomonadaceae bacterium]